MPHTNVDAEYAEAPGRAYESSVVRGSIVEFRGGRVLTREGDSLNTYHLHYYRLPVEPQSNPEQASDAAASQQRPWLRRLWPFSR